MTTWLRDLWRSRFRVVPKVRWDQEQVAFADQARAFIGNVEAYKKVCADLLRDCDAWLAERQPMSGRSAQKVESLRKRIKGILS